MKARAILFLIVTVSSVLVGLWLRARLRAAPPADISLPAAGTVVPLELYGGHLFIRANLSGPDAAAERDAGTFLLDSGAADMFISTAKAQALGLDLPPRGASENGAAVYVPNLSFQIGDLRLKDHRTAVMPQAELDGLAQYFGRTIDGVIGYELFQQLAVEVDYTKQQLHLYSPKTYQYQGQGDRLPLQIKDRRPYIDAAVLPYGSSPLQGTLMVDLGSNGALSVAAGCGLDRTLTAKVPKLLQRQLSTISGVHQVSVGRVQSLSLAQRSIKTPVTVFEKDDNDCDHIGGKIGAQILQQFRVIFDYPHRQLILESQTGLGRAIDYEYDLSGLRLLAQGDSLKTYRVEAVFPETPAAMVGLQKGDILTQLNHQPIQQMSLIQVRQQLSQPSKIVPIQVQRGLKTVQYRLKLQPLL